MNSPSEENLKLVPIFQKASQPILLTWLNWMRLSDGLSYRKIYSECPESANPWIVQLRSQGDVLRGISLGLAVFFLATLVIRFRREKYSHCLASEMALWAIVLLFSLMVG